MQLFTKPKKQGVTAPSKPQYTSPKANAKRCFRGKTKPSFPTPAESCSHVAGNGAVQHTPKAKAGGALPAPAPPQPPGDSRGTTRSITYRAPRLQIAPRHHPRGSARAAARKIDPTLYTMPISAPAASLTLSPRPAMARRNLRPRGP
ncbi:hypothetical protein DI396_06110 [Litorivita pollutaquae]|uniref:Uncharacterized protein n=1 Tax=Litorivita pollutaquae TaxID=2200892 RepID=A0A2V4MSN8_9RHOB|nr:hypothetical protein DI396_06110 [Litorivita pollutaquae]